MANNTEKKNWSTVWKDEFLAWFSSRMPESVTKSKKDRDLHVMKETVDKLPYTYWQLLRAGVMEATNSLDLGEYLAESQIRNSIQEKINDYLANGNPTSLTDAIRELRLNTPPLTDPKAAKDFFDRDTAQKRKDWADSVYAQLIGDLEILDELDKSATQTANAPAAPAREIGMTWKEELTNWVLTYGLDEGEEARTGYYAELTATLINLLPNSQCMFFREVFMKSGEDTEIDLSEHFTGRDELLIAENSLSEFLQDGSLSTLRNALFYMAGERSVEVIDPEAANAYFDAFEQARGVERPAPEANEFEDVEVLEELEGEEIKNPVRKRFIQRMRQDKDTFRQLLAELDKENPPIIMESLYDEVNCWYEENVKLERSAVAIIDAEYEVSELKKKLSQSATASPKFKANLEKRIESAQKQVKELYKTNDKLIQKTVKDLEKRAEHGLVNREVYETRYNHLMRGNLSLTPKSYLDMIAAREAERAVEARETIAETNETAVETEQTHAPPRIPLDLSGRINSQTKTSPVHTAKAKPDKAAPAKAEKQEIEEEIEEKD